MQLGHKEIQNLHRTDRVQIICDSLTTPENMGMVFRLADAFGVEKIHFYGTHFSEENKKMQRTARGTVSFIPFVNETDIVFFEKLKQEGFVVFGLEITTDSKDLRQIDFSGFSKKAIIVGSEKHGISPSLLEYCDFCAHIPMFGKNTSMNVVHALGIGLFAMV